MEKFYGGIFLDKMPLLFAFTRSACYFCSLIAVQGFFVSPWRNCFL